MRGAAGFLAIAVYFRSLTLDNASRRKGQAVAALFGFLTVAVYFRSLIPTYVGTALFGFHTIAACNVCPLIRRS